MKKLSVIPGRFQVNELHAGHINLIKSIQEHSDKLLIIIGTARTRFSKRNPLDYESRKQMLAEAFPDALFAKAVDFKSDEVWSNQIDDLISKSVDNIDDYEVTLYGSRQSFIPYYKGNYPTIEQLDLEVPGVSATVTRQELGKAPINSADFRAGVIFATQNAYPRVFPTVDVAIFNEDYTQVLLGRKHAETLFRFIGGFVDPADLDFEMAARREAMEETGVEVGDLEYIKSIRINDWRYVIEQDKIITTFFAGKYVMGVVKGADDIADARWFNVDNLTEDQLVGEHGFLLQFLKEYQKNRIIRILGQNLPVNN